MATLPRATQEISENASQPATGADLVCVLSPVATNADCIPRIYGSASACYAQHGYSEGMKYVPLHVERTKFGFMFVGLPIATPGVVGRENKSGNTGSSVTTVTAGGTGVLAEHDGVVRVPGSGTFTIGTDQVMLEYSLDGGRTFKTHRLGTGNSFAMPYFNVSIAFGAGTVKGGETLHTWHGTAPKCDSTGLQNAFAALMAQPILFRSAVLCAGDLDSDTEAQAFLDRLNAFETSGDRFIFGRASVRDRLPQASLSQEQWRMTGSPTLTFAEVGGTGDTITRSSGSWITDGAQVGDTFTVAGSAGNNVTGTIASLSATVIALGTTDLAAEGPVSNCTVVGGPTLTFAEVGGTGDTITRNRGSWLADGFRTGDLLTIDGTASNDATASNGVAGVTALVLTLGTHDLAAETIGAYGVTITAGETKAAWMASLTAEFESIDDAFRISLSAGRGRVTCPFSGWYMRLPAGWFASWREYQHDLHIAPWRKSDGPVGADLLDANRNLVEWDDYKDGHAGVAARFTVLRSWNKPRGGFVALSLTRGNDGSLLSRTHNVAVVNELQTLIQEATEDAAVGQSLILNDDGTATKDSLNTITRRVNSVLERGLLDDKKGEGPRASKAVWAPNLTDVFNVPEPTLTAVTDLNLNGTVHSVHTTTRIRAGGI